MSSSGTDKDRRTDHAAEQTGDFVAGHNTESGAHETAARPDPLVSLLRPPQADGELGRLAGFAVTRLLGQGGMGAVYEADDLMVRRKVALKVMRPELTARPEARERFLREAQTAGCLDNDHIIPVYQVGEDNGVLFIAMPLLRGEPLDARLSREGRLPISAVLKIGRETAEGLAAVAAVIVVKVRTPDGKETQVTAPAGSNVDVDAKGNVTVALPGDVPSAVPAEVTNGIGMKLKLIKPGKFTMGSPKEEEGRYDNEGPPCKVEINKAFYMGAYPVKGQFAAFVKDDDYQTDAEKDGQGGQGLNLATAQWEQKPEYTWRHPGFPQGDDHPVVVVSWNDAMAFCAWLSRKEGMTYELKEAEWEYACRAGTTTRFWCGDTDASLQRNANVADAALKAKCPGASWAVAWADEYAFTSPVGAFKPNLWGLYDMGGDVNQWCADGYGPYDGRFIKDPKTKESVNRRVLRGGSWKHEPRGRRSAFRDGGDAALAGVALGFRVVLRLPARPP